MYKAISATILAAALGLAAPQSFADPDGNGDVIAPRDVVAGRAVQGEFAIYFNGKGDGGDTLYESAGNPTWAVDNFNGNFRFVGGGVTRMTVNTGGVNSTGSFNGKELILNNGASSRIRLVSSGGEDHFIRNSNGVLELLTANGAIMTLDGATGNASFNNEVSSAVLEIRGAGNDVAEGFKIHGNGVEVEKGMVVSISPDKPGEMELSSAPYQRTVAGIISGAGDRRVGLQLGNAEEVKRGELTPVALTGQVWCKVDTSLAGIAPGDMLTTSAVPGHAMKVLDYANAQGAIIGKALFEGRVKLDEALSC